MTGHQIGRERCKSCLFTTFEPDTGFTNVRATRLDDHGWYVPFAEITSEASLGEDRRGLQLREDQAD